jgi:hypothetical protein
MPRIFSATIPAFVASNYGRIDYCYELCEELACPVQTECNSHGTCTSVYLDQFSTDKYAFHTDAPAVGQRPLSCAEARVAAVTAANPNIFEKLGITMEGVGAALALAFTAWALSCQTKFDGPGCRQLNGAVSGVGSNLRGGANALGETVKGMWEKVSQMSSHDLPKGVLPDRLVPGFHPSNPLHRVPGKPSISIGFP